MSPTPNKSLGQHWLHDTATLRAICDEASIGPDDTILEIGPGLGTLTQQLAKRAKQVIAVEFDQDLADKLPGRITATNVTVHSQDILHFDVLELPQNYKVVANVPYYITSKITEFLLTSPNPPLLTTLLVQKEVAQRMAAAPGDMSVLSVATQYFTETKLGPLVPAKLFTPPPKVDSQVVTLARRTQMLFPDIPEKDFFRVVKAGFGERRKKLRSSLSGGLRSDKLVIDEVLRKSGISKDARAQELTLDDWAALVRGIHAAG